MPYFSDDDNLEIGDNYTRGMLTGYLNIPYNKEEIERIVYEPTKYSTIFIFSTIINHQNYIYGKLSDTIFLLNKIDFAIPNHHFTNKEILLFIRNDDRTGFYYFGRCKYSNEIRNLSYEFPDYYCLELLDTKFSRVKGVELPEITF